MRLLIEPSVAPPHGAAAAAGLEPTDIELVRARSPRFGSEERRKCDDGERLGLPPHGAAAAAGLDPTDIELARRSATALWQQDMSVSR